MKHKVYIGSLEMDGDRLAMVPKVRVGIEDSDIPNVLTNTKLLDPRLDLRNHSPTGFEWGYGGSGPAQLALAILTDLFGEGVAFAFYQDFKAKVVGMLPQGRAWILSQDKIVQACSQLEGWREATPKAC